MFYSFRFSLRSLLIAVLVVALAIVAAKHFWGPKLDIRLQVAAGRGDVTAARWYLACGADIDSGHWTPLMKATFQGHTEMVRFLIDRGAELDHAEYHDSYTALRLAEFQGYWNIAIILANAGASDHIDDGRDWYVINYARHAGREDVVDALRHWHRANGTQWEQRQDTDDPPLIVPHIFYVQDFRRACPGRDQQLGGYTKISLRIALRRACPGR